MYLLINEISFIYKQKNKRISKNPHSYYAKNIHRIIFQPKNYLQLILGVILRKYLFYEWIIQFSQICYRLLDYQLISMCRSSHSGSALSQMDQLHPFGLRTGVIYPRLLFKYTQQHTTGFIKNNLAPHLLRPAILAITYLGLTDTPGVIRLGL